MRTRLELGDVPTFWEHIAVNREASEHVCVWAVETLCSLEWVPHPVYLLAEKALFSSPATRGSQPPFT